MSAEQIVIVVTRNPLADARFRVRARLRGRRGDKYPSIGAGRTIMAAIVDLWTCPTAAPIKRQIEEGKQP